MASRATKSTSKRKKKSRSLLKDDTGMRMLKNSPAFRGKKGKRGDRIGAGSLYGKMKSPI